MGNNSSQEQPSPVVDLASTLSEINTSAPPPPAGEVTASNGERITLGDSGNGIVQK